MGARKWLAIWLVLVSSAIFSVGLLNYAVDPFGVFGTKILREPFAVNRRYVKMEYLIHHKKDYNAFMIGSSRIGTTYPFDLERYLPGSSFYNMAAASANLYDDEMTIRYLLENDFDVKYIYLQIDLSHVYAYGQSRNDYQRKYHPYVNGESSALFYLNYLTILPVKSIAGKVLINLSQDYDMIEDAQTGMRFNIRRISARSENQEAYVRHEHSFQRKNSRRAFVLDDPRSLNGIAAFERIVKMCRESNVNLIVFTTPHNHIMMDTFNLEQTSWFVQALVQMHPIWYFSGYNSVTVNDLNYFESSHYTPDVGRMITARIFADDSVNIPDDFGILLTAEKKHQDLKMERKHMKRYNVETILTD